MLWLIPTIGLFLTSLLSPEDFDANGWWKVIAQPDLATWANYSNVWHNTDIPHSLLITAEIAIGGTLLPIIIAASRATRSRGSTSPGATGCSSS